jgi:biopolymer transport protein TolR
MPAVASARTGSRRRTINEINMVPFIDVMLVLLIIFMVSAPLMTTAMVELPSVGQGKNTPTRVVEVIVGADERLRLRIDNKGEGEPIELKAVAARIKPLQAGGANVPVIISADKAVKYEAVMRVMDTLQRNAVQRVGLTVRTSGP